MIKPFVRTESREVMQTPIFTMREDTATHPRTGRVGRYVVLESPPWVNVVALTEEGQYIMVQQWRHGVRRVEVEFAAGIVDAGEEPAVAAARELREETGYEAQSLTPLGAVAANPAYQDNLCHTFLATGCRKVHETDFDPGEDIEVLLVSPEEIDQMLASGKMRNAMGICALFWHRHSAS